MKVISCINKTPVETDELPLSSAVALGFFDGVHIGHKSLIKEIVGSGFVPVVYTFESHPAAVLIGNDNTEYITDNETKTEIFAALGAEYVVFEDFAEVKDMPPEQFVSRILCDKLHCKFAVCGENYRFGKNGEGDCKRLAELLSACGADCRIMPPVMHGAEQVSSTRIRELIKDGNAEEAAELLSRPYSFCSEVISGNMLGRTLGLPTVNQRIPKGAVIPKYGVYACLCDVCGRILHGVCDIGFKPTVGGTELLSETHIIGFDGDLYGKNIKISLCRYLRDEEKFASLDELVSAIKKDIAKTEKYFEDNAN